MENNLPNVSPKKFGLSLSFLILIFTFLTQKNNFWLNSSVVILSSVLALCSFYFPKIILPLQVIWFKIGSLLKKITTPIFLLLIFFMVLTPIALILKFFKKDILNIYTNPLSHSYWITNVESSNFENQF